MIAAEHPSPRAASRRWVVAAGLAVLALVAVVVAVRLYGSAPMVEPYGVRLGSSPGDTRDRFRAPSAGEWTSAAEPEPVLRWRAASADAPVHAAVFEFHSGMLVATRLDLDPRAPESSGPGLELTRGTVVARRPAEGGHVSLTVLSRDCPVHQDEIKRLLTGGR